MRILLYWASQRKLADDIVYSTSTPSSAAEIERGLPRGAIVTAYSGFRAKFGEVPADYEEVYVYADPAELERRFPPYAGPLEEPLRAEAGRTPGPAEPGRYRPPSPKFTWISGSLANPQRFSSMNSVRE